MLSKATQQLESLLQICREKGVVLRTAESCTAGAVAARLASVSGASDVLDRGWVTYSNQSKVDELGVAQELLDTYGAVSEPVVRAMAEGGASEHAVCIALSGIAGPHGGTSEKPVGTVWMAMCWPDHVMWSQDFLFHGDREQIQRSSVEMAVASLLSQLS